MRHGGAHIAESARQREKGKPQCNYGLFHEWLLQSRSIAEVQQGGCARVVVPGPKPRILGGLSAELRRISRAGTSGLSKNDCVSISKSSHEKIILWRVYFYVHQWCYQNDVPSTLISISGRNRRGQDVRCLNWKCSVQKRKKEEYLLTPIQFCVIYFTFKK